MWKCHREEPNNPGTVNYNANPVTNSESFKFKSNTGKKSNANQENGENSEHEIEKSKTNLKIIVPLKHLNNFWRTLGMSLINCEVSLTFT